MLRPLGPLALFIGLLTCPLAGRASPIVDDQAGLAVEGFDDLLGVDSDPSLTFNTTWDAWSRSISPTLPATPAQLVTLPLRPASVRAWGEVRIAASFTNPTEIAADVLDAAGNTLDTLVLTPSDANGWDLAGQIDPTIDPLTYPELRLRIVLDGSATPFPPVLERFAITWQPLSVLSIDASATPTVCGNAQLRYTVPVSISRVGGERVIVKLSHPTLADVPAFASNTALTFNSANQNGRRHSGAPIVIAGLSIATGDIYWDLNPSTVITAGTTFVLSATFNVPQGMVDGAHYRTHAEARALNAAHVITPDVVTAVATSPAPHVSIKYDGIYRIFDKDWAEPDSTITAELKVSNLDQPCRQTYYRGVVIHDLSQFFDARFAPGALIAAPTVNNGMFVPSGSQQTFYGSDNNPVVVAGPKAVWTLNQLAVGSEATFTWTARLAKHENDPSPGPLGSDDTIPTTAQYVSAYETETATANHTLYIDVPSAPSGVFAIGQRVNNSEHIQASADDLATTKLTYGASFGLPMLATNTGASKLLGVWLFQRVTPGTAFVAASAPPGTALYFSTAAAGATANPGRPFDATWNATSGTYDLGASWTTTAPAAGGAYWIAARVPTLASAFFPEQGLPNSVKINLTLRTLPAATACVAVNPSAYMVFDIESYLGLGDPSPTPYATAGIFPANNPDISGLAHNKADREPIVIDDIRPGFELSALTGDVARDGNGPVDYTLQVINNSSPSPTDTALSVDAVITFPRATINGVRTALPLIDFNVGSGQVSDISANGDSMTVHWDVLAPGAKVPVTLGFLWPVGGHDGDQVKLEATITGQDDFCGAATASLSTTTTYHGTPALRLSKSVNLAAVGVGAELEYRLRALNYSDTVSPNPVVFDRVPDNTKFLRGLPLATGAFWFSNAPSLPDRLNNPLAVTSDLLRSGLFTKGSLQGDGTWLSTVTNPAWIAVELDTGPAPILGAGVERDLRFVVEVADAALGTVISNRGLVDADIVLGAISQTTRTVVTAEPYLSLERTCGDVVSAGDIFSYQIAFYNNSSANDDAVTLSETLPTGLTYIGSSVAWNEAAAEHNNVVVTPTDSAGVLTWDITGAISGPLESLEGGVLTVNVMVAADLPSGTYLEAVGLGVAKNGANPAGATFYSACVIRVSNADLSVRSFVDRAQPIGGDSVLLTIIASNVDGHYADQFGLTITLPPELSANGPVSIASPAYRFSGGVQTNNQPVVVGQQLTWQYDAVSPIDRRRLDGPAGVLGRLEGNSGSIILRVPLLLAANTPADFPLTITSTVTTTTGQGDNPQPDTSQALLRTPLPDLSLAVEAAAIALPGDVVNVIVPYSNLSRQFALDTAVIVSLPADDAAPANPSATFVAAIPPDGVIAYYSDAPLNAAPPTFIDASSLGWAASPTDLLGPVTFIAFDTGPLSGLFGPDDIVIQLALANPTSGAQALPGAMFTTCATIAQVPATPDADATNDNACATTAVPGVNIAADVICTPEGANPGVIASAPVAAQLVLVNRGTTAAYGLSLNQIFGVDFSLASTFASTAEPITTGGLASTTIDISGTPIRSTIPVTIDGDRLIFGTTNSESDPLYYRNVGLRPGDRFIVPIQLTANPSALDNSVLTATINVSTDYQLGWVAGEDLAEEILGDNNANCQVTARRADPLVQITAIDPSTRTANDEITWQVTYDNIGSAPAADVVYTDLIEAGQSFVIGSLQGTPTGFETDYLGPTGWGYTPTAAAGTADPTIRGFRVTGDILPSPVAGGYALSGATMVATQGRIAVDDDGRLAATDKKLAYFTTPIIPGDDREVLAWRSINLGNYTTQAGSGVEVAVIDASNDQIVNGFESLPLDAQGFVDLSALSTNYQRIKLRVELTGGSAICDYTDPSTIRLGAPKSDGETYYQLNSLWGGNTLGDAWVVASNGNNRSYGFYTLRADGSYEMQEDRALRSTTSDADSFYVDFMNETHALVARYRNKDGIGDFGYRLYRRVGGDRWVATGNFEEGGWRLAGNNRFANTNIQKSSGRLIHVMRQGSGNSAVEFLVEGADGGAAKVRPYSYAYGVVEAAVSTTGDILTRWVGPSRLEVYHPNADLSDFSKSPAATPPAGYIYNGFSIHAASPNGDFATALTMVPSYRNVPAVLRIAPDGSSSWILLPLPDEVQTQSLWPFNVAKDGSILTAVNGASTNPGTIKVAYRPQADGSYQPFVFPLLSTGNYPTFNPGGQSFELSDANGAIPITYYDNNAAVQAYRFAIYQPGPQGYALEILPPLTGGANISRINGLTGAGGPVAELSYHDLGYSAVAFKPDGAGGWAEIFLGSNTIGTSIILPGPDNRLIGNTVSGPAKVTAWNLSALSPDAGMPAAGLKTFTNSAITVTGFGGPYVTGYQAYQSAPVPLVWGPGIGTDPTNDGWGYVALPLPPTVSWAVTAHVTADGFVVGHGQTANGPIVGIGWRPMGSGTWEPEFLEYNGGPAELQLSNPIVHRWDAPYSGDSPNIQPYNLDGALGDALARLIVDPSAAGGFQVVAFQSGGDIRALSHADKLVGGNNGAGQPMIAYVDADGTLHNDVLAHTGTGSGVGGYVSDIFEGVLAGVVTQSDGSYVVTVWRRNNNSWIEYPLALTTAAGIDPDLTWAKPLGILPGGHVFAGLTDTSVSVFVFDGSAYIESPLNEGEGDPAYTYYSHGSVTTVGGTVTHADYPWTQEARRDGFMPVRVETGIGESYWSVFGVPEVGGPAPHATLQFNRGTLIGYTGSGEFLAQYEGRFLLHRIAADLSAVETIELGNSSYHTEDPDTYQRPPFVVLYNHSSTQVAHAFHTVADPGSLDAAVARIVGPAGTVVSDVAVPAGSDMKLWAMSGAELAGFIRSSRFEPLAWGCVARPAASFDAIDVRFRSDESPAFVYTTKVRNECQTTARANISVTTTTPQISTANDSAQALVPVATSDVSVTLTANQRLISAGTELVYTATVTNAGPSAAANVVLTFASPTPSGVAPAQVAIGTLAAGQSAIHTFPFATAAYSDNTNLSANASVTSAAIDCVPTNASASATATISNLPNGYVSLSAPPSARAFEPFTISVSYGNNSGNTLSNAAIAATLPSGLSLVSGTPTRNVDLDPGQTGSYDLLVVADQCSDIGKKLGTQASLTAASDILSSDNAASASTTLGEAVAQLSLTVQPDRSEVPPSGLVRWTASIRNDGLQPATGINLSAAIPSSSTYVVGSLTRGTTDGSTVTVALSETLAPGDQRLVSFVTQANGPDDTVLTGTATLTGTGSCPATANYSAIIVTPLLPIESSVDRTTACGDGPLTWSVIVSNPGVNPIADVTVNSVVPAGTTYVGGSISGPGASANGATLSWNIGTLNAGAATTLSFKTSAPASHGAIITSVASISVGGVVVGTSNISSVTIDCDGGLTLAKSWDGDCQAPGGFATITLAYRNTGFAAAGGVIVDRLPSWLEPRLPVANATWDMTERTLTHTLGTIIPGIATRSYIVDINANAPQGRLVLPIAVLATSSGDGAVSAVFEGLVLLCNDNDACTSDACSVADGCVTTPVAAGAESIGSTSCQSGNGACIATGKQICDANGDVVCGAVPSSPTPEACDGIDNNCDNSTDEGFVGDTISCGFGTCAVTGTQVCVAGQVQFQVGQTVTATCQPLTTGCTAVDTEILTGPVALTSATSATFTYINPIDSSHTVFECQLDGGAWSPCNHAGTNPSFSVNGLTSGSHTLLVRAKLPDGTVDDTPAFWTWVVDTTVPDTIIVSGPTNPSQSASGTFVFGSPTPNPASYRCLLDPAGACPNPGAAGYAVCPATYAFSGLRDGSHTICVYVTDTKGDVDPVPATATWIIDTTPPETAIIAPTPAVVGAETSVVFNYVDPGAPTTNTFECKLDGADWSTCDGKTIAYADLDEGAHTFAVRTVDPNGLVDPTPATFAFTIDLTGPCVTIAIAPPAASQSKGATFALTAEVNATYLCALDPSPAELDAAGEPSLAAFGDCDSDLEYTDLADGQHTFWARSRDAVGNLGDCVASHTWSIDTRLPETEITSGPEPLTANGQGATFVYVDPDATDRITFECSLDGDAWTRCDGTSGGTGGELDFDTDDTPEGAHTFAVRACDFGLPAPDQCDPSPATWDWEVTVSTCPNDHDGPVVSCAATQILECVAGGAVIDLGAMTATATDACEPITVTTDASETVVLGDNPIVYVATDGNGNTASCMALVQVVDTSAPTITCPDDVLEVPTDIGQCTAMLVVDVATAVDGCQTTGLAASNDAPTSFALGETVVTHVVVDQSGHRSECAQRVQVVDGEPATIVCDAVMTVDAPADVCGWSGPMSATLRDNCAVDANLEVMGDYRVGDSSVVFTAEGVDGSCTTVLTVRDVTVPTVSCETQIDALPAEVGAIASDACGATLALASVRCERVVDGVAAPLAMEDCPITTEGEAITIVARLAAGALRVRYDAHAIDAAGNETITECVAELEPDGVADRDEDGIADDDDNCVDNPNTDQVDGDDDGVGDVCDPSPFDGFIAEGSGCAGGAGGLWIGALGLIGLAIIRRKLTIRDRLVARGG